MSTKHFLLFCAISLLVLPAGAKETVPARPTVPAEDYGRWETLWGPVLAADGGAFAHLVQRVDGERRLEIRRLEPEASWTVPWGTEPVFAKSGDRLTWLVTPSKEEAEALAKDKKPVHDRGELLDLASGERRDLGEVEELAFGPTGRFLAVLGTSGGNEEVSDLHIHDFENGGSMVFANVASFAWHEERPLLAMIVHSPGERGNAVQLFEPEIGRLVGLDHSASTYRHLVWSEETSALAVLRSPAPEDEDEASEGEGSDDDPGVDPSEYQVLAWTELQALENGQRPDTLRLDETSPGLDSELHITGDLAPRWAPDASRLSFGVRVREEKPAGANSEANSEASSEASSEEQAEGAEGKEGEAEGEPEEAAADGEGGKEEENGGNKTPEELAAVQIWHSSDVDVIARQQAQDGEIRRKSLLVVWDLAADRAVRVGSDLDREAEIAASWRHGIETDEGPYPWGQKFGRPFHDVWTVDLATGERVLGLEKVRYVWNSTGGRFILWFDGARYWSLELESGEKRDLTGALEAEFGDADSDVPSDGIDQPFGVAGWLEDDRAVLLYDRFDLWRIAPDGSGATRLTEGREDETVHRLVDLDEDEEAFSEARDLVFRLRNEWTEQQGIGRWNREDGYRRLLLEDRGLRELRRAADADVWLYRQESRTEAPALYLADGSFREPRQVATSNPFLEDYAWTRAELVEYHNPEGRKLHGVLLYPAVYEAGREYPMIVFAYEILSPSLHRWEPPDEKDYYNATTWTQEGYFVFLPDIYFRHGDPGVSAAETLAAAIETLTAKGLVDRERIGFVGHSWGGYLATYLAARTNLFAATVAGAPLTDFVSFMGQMHWTPGVTETSHWETGQARMVVPYWEDPEGHHRNSPLHGVHEMKTPILMAHGDDDGVVETFQATVFYNFTRRAEKPMVLLLYEEEGHGFRREENQIDYHRRILEWFGHYLEGEPAPAWITEGVSWRDHEGEKRRIRGGDGELDPGSDG